MEFINHLVEVVNNFMSGTMFVTLGVVIEMVLRFIPSEKPMGVVHMVSGVLKSVANLAGKLAELLDKLLPQKLK